MLFRRKTIFGKISIGITTFEHRFDKYFVPLLSKIREYDNDTEIIVAVNGEHDRDFGENYRKRILEFLSSLRNVYPFFFPRFRGLSKLWNTIIIHATCDHILMLNDDIMITKRNLIEKVQENIQRSGGKSFVLNKSWSHFVVSREEISELGYFDERLLGIGEEDGDLTWRYIQRYGRPISNYTVRGLVNYADETVHSYQPINIKCHSGTKYSQFNRQFMFKQKYKSDVNGINGMFEHSVTMNDKGPDQYPNERFYREHKDEL
jgi:glycosyltransferase involved in cell wall biosynthesis